MAFTIPSYRGSLEDPAGHTPPIYPLAQVDPVDFTILGAAAGGRRGVVSGCAVTASSPAAMNVDVASGRIAVDGTGYNIASSADLTIAAAHASMPRFDMVVATTSGTASVVQGTPATSSPQFPTLADTAVALAVVYVPAAVTTIVSTYLVDKRVMVLEPPAASSGWTTKTATSDLTRSNTSTVATDSAFTFAMAANTKYRVRAQIWISANPNYPSTQSNAKWAISGPSSPTLVAIQRLAPALLVESVVGIGAGTMIAYPVSPITMINASTWTQPVAFSGIIHNGANTGDFVFQWAQNTAIAENTIRRAGSYLEYEAV